MKVVKDSYISINFYFVENIQSQIKQTPIKYFKGELLHVNAFTCISHVIKLKIKIISGRGLFKMTGHRHQNLKGMWNLTPQLAQSSK
jgi:hypothetical protein